MAQRREPRKKRTELSMQKSIKKEELPAEMKHAALPDDKQTNKQTNKENKQRLNKTSPGSAAEPAV